MEAADLRWCCGSSSNDWDLHAVVRFASCSGGGSRVTTSSPLRASDEPFSSCLLPPQSQTKDEVTDAAAPQQLPTGPAVGVDDLCLQQAFLATAQPRNNEAPPAAKRPRTPYRSNNGGGGGPTRSKRKYVSAPRAVGGRRPI
jgi:WRKY transcription factor 22